MTGEYAVRAATFLIPLRGTTETRYGDDNAAQIKPRMQEERNGSAVGRRHQDPRGARLEGRAHPAFRRLVVLAEAAGVPQPQGHSVAVASGRPARQRELPAVVPRHQSARPGAGAGARRRGAHREQRHHRASGAGVSRAAPHSERPRERSRGAASPRGRSAPRPAHAELPLRVRAARSAQAGRGAGELRRERHRHRARRSRPPQAGADRRSGSAPPAKASPTNGPAPRRRNSAPSSTSSTARWRRSPT